MSIQRKATRIGVMNGEAPATGRVSAVEVAKKFKALQARRAGVYGVPGRRRSAFFGQGLH